MTKRARRGLAMPQAVELAVVNTGTGVFASACIMALAFLMPMFTDFKGIAELGLVSAAGLFMCLISALAGLSRAGGVARSQSSGAPTAAAIVGAEAILAGEAIRAAGPDRQLLRRWRRWALHS